MELCVEGLVGSAGGARAGCLCFLSSSPCVASPLWMCIKCGSIWMQSTLGTTKEGTGEEFRPRGQRTAGTAQLRGGGEGVWGRIEKGKSATRAGSLASSLQMPTAAIHNGDSSIIARDIVAPTEHPDSASFRQIIYYTIQRSRPLYILRSTRYPLIIPQHNPTSLLPPPEAGIPKSSWMSRRLSGSWLC